MVNNGPAYISFIVVIIILLCLGTWLRRRRIQAAMIRREQLELESRIINRIAAHASSWDTGPLQPPHAHVRQPHSLDNKPEEYLPPYTQPMSGQPPPYVSSAAGHLPSRPA
ncbi:hypothetical protein IWW37_002391 [Coemansia sp. RSA 2050]|nr:hypothetical protein IWW37_002391 [Coemansia sp. RSA 2050]KAJ2734424.1 hypothetical protein IW152_002317 [Coemansia sp. BCRC 34962]